MSLFFSLIFFLITTGAAVREETEEAEYVPIAQVIEYFELDFKMNAVVRSISISNGTDELYFFIGSTEGYLADRVVFLKSAPYLDAGQVFIPAGGVDLIIRNLVKRNLRWHYRNGKFSVGTGYGSKGDSTGGEQRKEMSSRKRNKADTRSYDIQTIVIDPGHGGSDPGGIGRDNINEKDIVLKVSNELKKELEKRYSRKDVLMTRADDSFISLENRGELANGIDPAKNAIFISIHANVSFAPATQGFETYFLSLEPMDEEARDVALMENSVLDFEIQNYSDHLKEIINRIVDIEYRRESMRLAGYIQQGIEKAVGNKSPNRGAKSAFFYVLKAVKMPSVLIEIGFVTNPEESDNLLDSGYQKKVAMGIADGVSDFIKHFSETEGFTK